MIQVALLHVSAFAVPLVDAYPSLRERTKFTATLEVGFYPVWPIALVE